MSMRLQEVLRIRALLLGTLLLGCAGIAAAQAAKTDALSANVPEAKDFQLVYDLDLAKLGPDFAYTTDNSAQFAGKTIDRIAYFIELQPKDGGPQYLYVSMDAFTGDATKIGLPTAASEIKFQQPVANLTVVSNVKDVVTGTGLKGNIEFWSTNYAPKNTAGVEGADDTKFDFGDEPTPGNYGSMQVHNAAAKQTLFTISHWLVGRDADIGIGNAPSGNPDWTFSKSSKNYDTLRLRVLVHVK